MEVNLTHLEKELTGLKIGRANPAILDKVQIDTGDEYGIVPLKQLGQVSIKDNQTLTIQLFEDKFLKVVEKSILTSKLNLTPIINNNKINVPIPKLTSETREQLIKQVHLIGENNKLKLRNIRQSGMKQIQTIKKKKNSGISADEIKNLEKELQSILESNNKKVDTLVNDKIKVIKS
ncbi:ribosome recycling factor [Neoconidiobolus thromboides FSU 785]|nr:ribosome recycling factor [Neoconidiobolus thromboides FSU 785]